MKLTTSGKAKLDSKDKKIIEQLQKNCRQSVSRIAKATKLPRDVVVYRIKKLEQSKVISGHHSYINPAKIGYPLYSFVLFQCYNLKPEVEGRFISYLVAHKNLAYVAKNSGEFDFTIGVCAKDYLEFDEILRQIRQRFVDVIKDIKITPVIEEYKIYQMSELI
ncbi:Lrp/AsnC family transcriptional regulator [Candidatus Woesearchaeota archaeon]|nr:Lrp/AsnC family transcriptional regulator [Candidatus Woesearchaeota archaeon]